MGKLKWIQADDADDILLYHDFSTIKWFSERNYAHQTATPKNHQMHTGEAIGLILIIYSCCIVLFIVSRKLTITLFTLLNKS